MNGVLEGLLACACYIVLYSGNPRQCKHCNRRAFGSTQSRLPANPWLQSVESGARLAIRKFDSGKGNMRETLATFRAGILAGLKAVDHPLKVIPELLRTYHFTLAYCSLKGVLHRNTLHKAATTVRVAALYTRIDTTLLPGTIPDAQIQ